MNLTVLQDGRAERRGGRFGTEAVNFSNWRILPLVDNCGWSLDILSKGRVTITLNLGFKLGILDNWSAFRERDIGKLVTLTTMMGAASSPCVPASAAAAGGLEGAAGEDGGLEDPISAVMALRIGWEHRGVFV